MPKQGPRQPSIYTEPSFPHAFWHINEPHQFGSELIAGFEVIRLMRRELAELTEMMSLGAGIPGDEQRIDMIKGLLARWHKKVPVIICIEAGAARMVRATRWAGFSSACCNVDAVTRAARELH